MFVSRFSYYGRVFRIEHDGSLMPIIRLFELYFKSYIRRAYWDPEDQNLLVFEFADGDEESVRLISYRKKRSRR